VGRVRGIDVAYNCIGDRTKGPAIGGAAGRSGPQMRGKKSEPN
jgi:hypothetical protein